MLSGTSLIASYWCEGQMRLACFLEVLYNGKRLIFKENKENLSRPNSERGLLYAKAYIHRDAWAAESEMLIILT